MSPLEIPIGLFILGLVAGFVAGAFGCGVALAAQRKHLERLRVVQRAEARELERERTRFLVEQLAVARGGKHRGAELDGESIRRALREASRRAGRDGVL